MKFILSLSILITTSLAVGNAQAPFKAAAILDLTHIRVQNNVQAGNWHDSANGKIAEFPKGSGKHIGADAALWLTGKKNGLDLANSSTVGNQSDFWPGPWNPNPDFQQRYNESAKWNKIWTVSQTEIDSFLRFFGTATPFIPASILFWPAKGNLDAQDAFGQQLIILTDRAPFVDVDSNGRYEPFKGDYPKIKGDQMHWWLTHDNGYDHTPSAEPLDVEVAHLSYVYDRWANLQNIVFYEYLITAKGLATITDFRTGFYENFDIGEAQDDVPGYDSARRLAYITNRTDADAVYRSNIPVAGAMVLEFSGDIATIRNAIGAMTFWKNDGTINGLPSSPQDKDNVMRQLLNGNNGPSTFPGSTYTTCNGTNLPADYQFVTASQSRLLLTGNTVKVAMAMIVDADAGGCPNTNLVRLKQSADTAWKVYWNGTTSSTSVAINNLKDRWSFYPNPANNQLFIRHPQGIAPTPIGIKDLAGRRMDVPIITNVQQSVIDISALPNGLYFLHFGMEVKRFTVLR